MQARIILTLAAALAVPSAPQAQGGYAEPPPSPPVKAAPTPVAPVEPPTAPPPPAATPMPTPTAIPTPDPSPTATPTATPTPTAIPTPAPDPSTTTSTSATPTATATATPTPTPTSEPTSSEAAPQYEPYSPYQMTWGIPPSSAGASASAGAADPSPASSTYRGVEWGVGAIATDGGGMLEGTVLADLGAVSLGMMVAIGGRNEHPGAGILLAGGPRFRLADGIRLDGLVDAGLFFFGHDDSERDLAGSQTTGSEQVLPAIGARLGVTFTSAASGWYLSLGAAVRHIPRTAVEYTTTQCPIFGRCTTTPGTAVYGGTIAGGYLTVGQGAIRRRP